MIGVTLVSIEFVRRRTAGDRSPSIGFEGSEFQRGQLVSVARFRRLAAATQGAIATGVDARGKGKPFKET